IATTPKRRRVRVRARARRRAQDVGGQRSERKHWRECVEGTLAIMFVASLSDYDLPLREDPSTGRLKEALLLWEDVCASSRVADKAIILFLNKVDIFKEKCTRKSIRCCFPDYTGADTFAAASDFIRQRFLSRKSPRLEVFAHLVSA